MHKCREFHCDLPANHYGPHICGVRDCVVNPQSVPDYAGVITRALEFYLDQHIGREMADRETATALLKEFNNDQ